MSLSQAQKSFLANMSPDEQEQIKKMEGADAKDIIKGLMADDDVEAKTAPPPSVSSSLTILARWALTGEHNGCLVCGNDDLEQTQFNKRCRGPCNSFIYVTNDGQKNKEGKSLNPLNCGACRQVMAPSTAYHGRTTDDGKKVYYHVRVADCHGTKVPGAGGSCGVCKKPSDALFNPNTPKEDGTDNTLCDKCFRKARASGLRKCQEGAIAKRNNSPYNTPEKKRKGAN